MANADGRIVEVDTPSSVAGLNLTNDYVAQNFEAYGTDNSSMSTTIIFHKDISAIQCTGRKYPWLIVLAVLLFIGGIYVRGGGLNMVCFAFGGLCTLLYFVIRPHTIAITAHSGTSIIQKCTAKESRTIMEILISLKRESDGTANDNDNRTTFKCPYCYIENSGVVKGRKNTCTACGKGFTPV